MRRSSITKLVATAIVCFVAGLWAGKDDEANKKLDNEVRQAEQERAEAVVKGDSAALNRIMADEFVQVTHRGELRTKRHRLAAYKEGAAKYEVYKNDIDEVRLFGDVAIVTGITTRTGEESGRKITGTYRFTRVWQKRDARWQLLHLHWTKYVQ